jgi:diguanylate cyclase (GGDEF)-like protein
MSRPGTPRPAAIVAGTLGTAGQRAGVWTGVVSTAKSPGVLGGGDRHLLIRWGGPETSMATAAARREAGPGYLVLARAACLALMLVPAPGTTDAAAPPSGVVEGAREVLEDPAGAAALDEILTSRARFRPLGTRTPNYGFSASAFWFRIPVRNQRAEAVRLFAVVPHPTLDEVTLHAVDAGGGRQVVRSGDRIPARDRPYGGATLVLPFRIEANGAVDLYVRVRAAASALLVPIEIQDEPALQASELSRHVVHGAVLGAFGALFIYNGFVFLVLRERSYLVYVLFLPLAYMAISALDGFGPAFLYPTTTWPANEGLVVVAGLSFCLILMFTRAFLRTAEFRDIDLVVRALVAIGACLTVSPFLVPIRIAYPCIVGVLFVLPLICLATGIATWRRGRTEARFYVLGQGASWIGFLTFAMLSVDLLPYHWVAYESISIGVAADALLLSLALADRIRLLQQARREADERARANLELRQEELQRLVADRTAELERARRDAERLATLDPLTGVNNRRGFLTRAEAAVKLAVRAHRPLAVLSLDLDRFKAVNDTYGHAEGDRVLRDIAIVAVTVMRATDVFGRIGGEEFVAVLPETGRDGAMGLAERLRGRIAADVAVGRDRTPVTVSVGVAWVPEHGQDLESLERAADAALYRAKRGGRNRVEAADVVTTGVD